MNSIILIDDSKLFVRIIDKFLQNRMNVLGHAHNGEDGFQLFEMTKPDIILLDITMPICSGKQCLEKIMKYNPNAKVIMVSSVGDEDSIQECLNLGAKAFVPKDSISTMHLDESCLLWKTILAVVQQNIEVAA